MSKIPPELLATILADPWYKTCCLKGIVDHKCIPHIQFHHNLIYAGSQLQALYCILPLDADMHKLADNTDIKEILNWIMLNRATDLQLQLVSKAVNYTHMRDMLNKKFGKPWKPNI